MIINFVWILQYENSRTSLKNQRKTNYSNQSQHDRTTTKTRKQKW